MASARTTPAFSFIVPNLCDDGHDAPCVTGVPGGLAQAGAFVSQWVPKIMAAPTYRDGGLIVVTFDEGSDAAACCGETSGSSPGHPNVPEPGKNGPGGGRIGAVLLSPLIRPGTSTVEYNHYSLLRTVEDIFGLPRLAAARFGQARSAGPRRARERAAEEAARASSRGRSEWPRRRRRWRPARSARAGQ
nr:alkaline phosphatase family protein [Trebonia kvetii]